MMGRHMARSIVVRILRTLRIYGVTTKVAGWVLPRLRSSWRRLAAPANEKVIFTSRSVHQGSLVTTYRGIVALRCPFDYVIYQMILSELKPDLVIEVGTNKGGGALYLGDLMNALGHGVVHTIDIENNAAPALREHPRIRLFTEGWEGYDIAEARQFASILVIEDASHVYEQTLGAMCKLAPLVSVGSYLIVEDGIVSELGTAHQYNGGPLRAIHEFLKSNSGFVVDSHWCDFYGRNATSNIRGYLKRTN
jgi:cephalosporin hydroxylase